MTFDWEPQTPAGVDVTPSGRGTDARIDKSDRVGAAERRQGDPVASAIALYDGR